MIWSPLIFNILILYVLTKKRKIQKAVTATVFVITNVIEFTVIYITAISHFALIRWLSSQKKIPDVLGKGYTMPIKWVMLCALNVCITLSVIKAYKTVNKLCFSIVPESGIPISGTVRSGIPVSTPVTWHPRRYHGPRTGRWPLQAPEVFGERITVPKYCCITCTHMCNVKLL